ncbi:DUF1656 domain-containing protein [Herbaspirillum sp. RTI4]|uniref:DUF1656 domain-containing protein n=1 Tax=Herbaspirillum sp. RTI4 TaxID=3048640 RepID=UPI002AB427CF|nr:DUF1656 domain-containing protein [Herbaspirillum sp. RTI4]MDY7578389.1 DUF1656 domain-containing protein [Herbaspirillum sp. RTI4]MEA9983070.1 DUF1656 domain-containing protein [Herbaspirillum sp. RTI4]
MPREISLFGAYIPTLLLIVIATGLLTMAIDRLLVHIGWYRLVWHPALFRISLFVCLAALSGLWVYQ